MGRKSKGSPSRGGMGIGVKFALAVSVALTIVVSLLGLVVYNQTRTALEESIQTAGTFAAAAGSAPDWHHENNRARLKGMLSDTVVEVIIWEKHGKQEEPVVIASGSTELRINRGVGELDDDYRKVRVAKGTFTDSRGREIPVRTFRHPIASPEDERKPIAQFEVVLSEEKIQEKLSSILFGIVGFTILGIFVSVGVSFLVARNVTRPLQLLTEDVKIVARGELQHRTRVRSLDEIGLLASNFNEMTRALEENLRLKEDLSSKEHQEQITQEIQEKLFPASLPQVPQGKIHAVFEPAGDISSDLFDFIDVSENSIGLLVLTASGRGVPAAVVLAMARSVFRASAPGNESPSDALRRINALFSPDLRRGMYVTATYVVYDKTTHEARIANAGHQLPVVAYSAEKGTLGRVHPGGIAMGLDEGPVFDRSIEEASRTLTHPGDALLLGSAGITALALKDGEPLGEKRFYKAVQTAFTNEANDPVQDVVETVSAHLGDDPGPHDITLVSLART